MSCARIVVNNESKFLIILVDENVKSGEEKEIRGDLSTGKGAFIYMPCARCGWRHYPSLGSV